jgi:hypothetical protein
MARFAHWQRSLQTRDGDDVAAEVVSPFARERGFRLRSRSAYTEWRDLEFRIRTPPSNEGRIR